MKLFFEKDVGGGQFNKLNQLYVNANSCLLSNVNKYPEYKHIWTIVVQKMAIIKAALESNEIPSAEKKREADISTMMCHALRDLKDEDTLPLYKLSSAFTLLGMKDMHLEQNNTSFSPK